MPYHVRITSREPQRRSNDPLALDKDADWIKVLLSEVLKRPGPTTGELIARIDNNGRQIFSVDASKLEWQLKFTVL